MAKEEATATTYRGSQMVETLMAKAIEAGNLDAMERVMAIRRELKAEAAKEAFFVAMSAFQAECPVIKRKQLADSGKGFSYHYASLDQIVKQVGPLIAKHGLSYNVKAHVEPGKKENDPPYLVAQTHVYHEEGHTEFSEFRVPVDSSGVRNKQQEMGNSNSYAKRYSFTNAFGILTEEDDLDGGRITPQQAREAKQPVRQPQQTPTAQKANGPKVKVQLEPAGEGESIDTGTIKGLAKAMENATLSNVDFTNRFPKLTGLEQVKKADSRTVMSWIADPQRN
jgi:hypothetical protein